MRDLHSHKFRLILFSLVLVALGSICACSSTTARKVDLQSDANHRSAIVININTATAVELETLPHVGAVLAQRIVEHRNRYGAFRRPEHLLEVEGISEKRFRELKEYIDTK